jgi:hypothetical protein
MANAHRPTSGAPGTTRARNRRTIPTDSGGHRYAEELDQYLDQLLDEALDLTFPASDALAVPTRRDLEQK